MRAYGLGASGYDRRVDARPAAEPSAVLVKWMGIIDANTAGFIHGGTVMKLCDEAAGLAAIKPLALPRGDRRRWTG